MKVSTYSPWLIVYLLPQVRFTKLIKLCYWIHSKYWSWKQQRCRQQQRYSSELDKWDNIEAWTLTDIVNDVTLSCYDKYYDTEYPFIGILLFLIM